MSTTTGGGVAVVTGGTAGVGRAAVRALAGAGYDVAVLARGRAGLEGAIADVEGAGRRALAPPTDVSDHAAVSAAAERVEDALGEIDVWVNAAFVGTLTFARDIDIDEFRRVTEVTYYGQVHGTLTALERMRPRNRGVIVNVASAMTYRAIPLQAAYCGAKHAVKGFTESVRTELVHERSAVRLCMVQLPGMNTPQFNWNASRMPRHPMPVPPIYQPELAGRAIAFLVEHPRSNMWVGLATAYTILGERLAPKVVDLFLGRTGVDSQQTDRELPRWGSNLFEPRDEEADRGAHGPFDEQAHSADPVLWMSMRRRALLTGLGGLAAVYSAVAAGTARCRGRSGGALPRRKTR